MSRDNTTLSSFAAAAARAIEARGLDSRALFRQSGLDPEALKNPNARYTDRSLGELLGVAAGAAGDPALGLNVAAHVAPSSLHALGFSLLASQSLEAALLRLVRYYRIVTSAAGIELHKPRNDLCPLSLSFDPGRELPPVFADAVLATLLTVLRWLRGPDYAPRLVRLRRPAPDAETARRFREHFRAEVEFGCEGAGDLLLLERVGLDVELPTSNAELAYQNDKIVADYLARFDNSRLSERVRTIFIERLVTGKFSEEQVAEQLNLSLRSMQRRLRDEQTSYQQLLDETRLDLALQYINRTSLTVAQIAPLLGFSDSSNFNRAFKRWLGISPSKYRALGLA